ncbi:uncharacterized protein LODBEIA_P02740 [Lodderomyces beijingensis]|uniref:UBX domain-containing protein n=1 Tax=Lodderomyces beijingensis TaxID=1775926 RepID=A0ABP0ZFU5_9ASCO
MDEHIPTFLAVTGIEDEAVAKQFLDVTGGDLDMAVTLYMESGQHGGGQGASGGNGGSARAPYDGDDEALAKQLQEQAYGGAPGQDHDDGGDGVREADANVHRHETLIDSIPGYGGAGGLMSQMHRQADMFGRRQQGIFHQGFNFQNGSSMNSFHGGGEDEVDEEVDDDDEEEEDDDDDYDGMEFEGAEGYNQSHDVQIIDSDEEDGEGEEEGAAANGGGYNRNRAPRRRSVGRRRQLREQRDQNLTSVQRRLANLFRPPFDIISVLTLDQARAQAKETKKWILVNIQDSSEFQSQVLNRDFWSNSRVKQIVRENFIFLQYQNDSFDGESYVNFYHVDQFPHIAIIDPLTGERVYRWKDGQVPEMEKWISEVYSFLDSFSLAPDSKNPLVKHERKLDLDSLSEEQQIELAMKQSVLDSDNINNSNNNNNNNGKSIDDAINLDSDDDDTTFSSEGLPKSESAPSEPIFEPFEAIKAIDHKEPTEGPTTRVQIRFPNGKRLVRRLGLQDPVVALFEWLKFVLSESGAGYGLNCNDKFTLSNSSDKSFKFIQNLDRTIEQANLKNASILLEKD